MGNSIAKELTGSSCVSVVRFQKRTLRIIDRIGEGAFSFVYLLEDLSDGKHFALKRMPFGPDNEAEENIKQEVELLESLRSCPSAVAFAGYRKVSRGDRGSEGWLLTEYCEGGWILSLMEKRLLENGGKKKDVLILKREEMLRIMFAVLDCLENLHSRVPPVAHRDIKAENILCDASGRFKLCDFGSATVGTRILSSVSEIQDEQEEVDKNTTLDYRSPELVDLHSRVPLTEKVDIWAVGILLYKLCFFRMPFEESKLKIIDASFSIPDSPKIPENFKETIRACLQKDPEKRPTARQVRRILEGEAEPTLSKQEVQGFDVDWSSMEN